MAKKIAFVLTLLIAIFLYKFVQRSFPTKTKTQVVPAGIDLKNSKLNILESSKVRPQIQNSNGRLSESQPLGTVGVETQWNELMSQVRDLDSEDQNTLDNLYAKAKKLITQNGSAYKRLILSKLPDLKQASLPESFFTLSTWLRYSSQPSTLIEELLQNKDLGQRVNDRNGQRQHDSLDNEHHLEDLTPESRWKRMQAFGLRELREQVIDKKIPVSEEEKAMIVKSIMVSVKNEKSLDVSLEMFQILDQWADRQTIEQALSYKNQRDQKLIKDFLELR